MLEIIVRYTKHSFSAPRRTLETIYSLIFSTAEFARTRIDTKPKDLSKAILFYLAVFGFVFVLYTIIARFSFYQGVDHKRELAFLVVQVAIGVIALYIVNKLYRSNVTLKGTLQAVLYIDAPFLLLFAFVRLAVAFVGYHSSLYGREPDVIENEFESCVASSSYIYQLLRGDLTFLLHADDPTVGGWIRAFDQYGELILILPFCLLFAKLMHYRFGTSILMNCTAGVLAYLLATTTFAKSTELLRDYSSTSSGCWNTLNSRLIARYSTDFLADQAILRVNNRVTAFRNERTNWLLRNKEGDIFVNVSALSDQQARTNLSNQMQNAFYCSSDVEFKLIRELKLKFATVHRLNNGGVVEADVLSPNDCPHENK